MIVALSGQTVRRQANVHCLKCAESVVASYSMN